MAGSRIAMCLAAKINKERLRAKQPVGIMQEFHATASGPSNLRVLVGLREITQTWGRKRRRITANAVIAECVIDLSVGQTAGAIEQPSIMDHDTGATANGPEPVHSALKTELQSVPVGLLSMLSLADLYNADCSSETSRADA